MNIDFDGLRNSPWALPVGVGVAALAGGIGIGYVIGAYQWKQIADKARTDLYETSIEEDSVQETEEPEYVVVINDDVEVTSDPVFVRSPEEILPKRDPSEITVDLEVQQRIDNMIADGVPLNEVYAKIQNREKLPVNNIFQTKDDHWDFDEEVKLRMEKKIYVLHRDEFFDNEFDFVHTTLTYFKVDDILVDDREVPIYNYSNVVGDLLFGHGSMDPNVVYIRNEDRECEYEVLLDHGSYEVEILGLDDSPEEIKHSSGVRKFRWDD